MASPADSETWMTLVVQPNDTNPLGTLHGGRLLYWMDECSSIAATKHSRAVVVTVSVDGVSFRHAIELGSVVTIRARVTRTFRTSMEVFVEVWAENIPRNQRIKCNEAYYTFVALDERKQPLVVPDVVPTNEEERRLFDGAMRRRQLRLILAGKLKAEDADALRALFMPENPDSKK
ncbi:MAG: acyl-CoA thioesterase [Chitinophagales bacterium]|nr:acyl-CoA thioesterase [Chitinophagales bacterium]MDW8428305.1 acyl-CoA thioesterase [Chitinophagales bacterium]